MLFPDYFFFAERRLVNHVVETKNVKDLDHCELFCYMNDNCVSANFKKEPEAGGMAHVCELNNATHLDFDTDLITNADFYHRGSKVINNSKFTSSWCLTMNQNKKRLVLKFSFISSFVLSVLYLIQSIKLF